MCNNANLSCSCDYMNHIYNRILSVDKTRESKLEEYRLRHGRNGSISNVIISALPLFKHTDIVLGMLFYNDEEKLH